jgi:predicted N-formylglutamate amidohydrolase
VRRPKRSLILTCEHAGNHVPAAYAPLFEGAERILETHKGYDPGSLDLGKSLAKACKAPLLHANTTRLLVDLNRSIGNPALNSPFTARLSKPERLRILDRYYHPHREAVENLIRDTLRTSHQIIHIGVHTFTPTWDGQTRRVDIGLLYNPARTLEARFCFDWKECLEQLDAGLVVRRNFPYLGKADGLTTHLRRMLPADRYLGIELEVNQKFWFGGKAQWRKIRDLIVEALSQALNSR